MLNPPEDTKTFLFTDIEGSTKLAQEFPDKLQTELEKHHVILRNAIESNNGFIFEIIGDAFCASFTNPFDAVKAASDAQSGLSREKWDEVPIKVRMGIHTGPAEWNGKRYIGYITLARTQRIMSAAYGRQILISNETYINVKDKIQNEISFRDLGERRLKDLIQPMRIYQVISKELPSDFPPLKTLDARPNNLPVQLTNFLGREKDINEIKKLLSDSHLLTLVGPGGTGKTRLCLQVAADIIDDYENGVWFIDLAPLKDGTLLPQTIAQAIGIKEESQQELTKTLINYFKEKEILILLDNCEHIIESCSNLSGELLINCPKLKIMATSREMLRINGETVYYVTSLELPDMDSDNSMDSLTQFESVKFFIERALSVKPGFQVTNENAPAVAEICFKLDGIPLAIELAAARVKVLSVEQICERLNDRFKLLISGSRTSLPRQKTLKALIDWSYDLLTEKEKILWRRLSVFAGGWTLEAAEEVCWDENLNYDEILDTLSQLVDKSIVIYNETLYRYKMLETIRQYGEEELETNSELEKIIIKHLDYYLSLAEISKNKLIGSEQKEWMEKLDSERSNFQVALVTSIVRGCIEKGVRLATGLCRYWETRGYNSEAKNWLEEFLSSSEDLPVMEKANALQWSGTFEWITGNYSHAQTFYEKSYEIQKQLNNKQGIAVSLNNLGLVLNITGRYEESKILTEQSYDLFKELGNKPLIADSLLNLGSTYINLNDYERAKSAFEECLDLYREIGDKRGIGMILNNLGSIYGLKNDYESSRAYLEDSLSIQRELKDNRSISMTLGNLGAILSYQGYYKKAKEYLEESIKINTELGDQKGLASSMNTLGFIKYTEEDISNALYLHRESLKLRIKISNQTGINMSILGISESISDSDPVKASLLLGATEEALYSIKEETEKEVQYRFEKTILRLKEKLGEEKFNEAFDSGKDLNIEQASELALRNE